MALKLALLTFEFESIKGLRYEPKLDYDFAHEDPVPFVGVQPVVTKAFKRIKKCIAGSIASSFHFGHNSLQNINNLVHIGTSAIQSEVGHTDGTVGQASSIFIVKFYRLEPNINYKVTIDIEDMPTTGMANATAFKFGMSNSQLSKLVGMLDKKFHLRGKIEAMPVIKRGRLDAPRFLISSDERLMEYDFDRLLFHQTSEFQDIKIVSSPSLGNTLLLDNLQNLAEADLEYTYTLMDRGRVSYKDKNVLILGGGDGGLLYELLKESPKLVTMAEIDGVVIRACREHLRPCGEALESLEGPNHKILIKDCKEVLRQSIADGVKYDVILNDLTDIPVSKREESLVGFEPSAVQKDSPWHFIEAIFNLSLQCLADDGVYMNHATGNGNKESIKAYEDFLRESRVPVEFESRLSYVPSFMEIWVFYSVRKQHQQASK